MSKMKKIGALSGGLALLPLVAFAQGLGNVETLVESLGDIVNLLLPIVVSIALLFFFWGLAVYILNAGNEEKKAEGKNIMIWGVIALFIMVSIWGIVNFIGSALDIEQGGTAPVPGVEDTTGGSSGPT